MQFQRLDLQGQAEVLLHLPPFPQLRLHGGFEEAYRAAPLGLGAVQGGVRVAQQAFRRRAILGVKGDADAGADLRHVAVEDEGRDEAPHDPAGQGFHPGPRGRAPPQDHELVAAQAGHRVVRADQIAQPPRHLPEEVVARRVAVGVVHHLEAVEIQRQHHEVALPPAGLPDRRAEAFVQQGAVGEAGQRIVVCQEAHPPFRQGLLRDVGEGPHEPAIVQNLTADLQHRAVGARAAIERRGSVLPILRAVLWQDVPGLPGAQEGGLSPFRHAEQVHGAAVHHRHAAIRRHHDQALADVLDRVG